MRWLLVLFLGVVMVAPIYAQEEEPDYLFSWSLPLPTEEQLSEVRACNIKTIITERYSDLSSLEAVRDAYQPESPCDWAVLAVAYVGWASTTKEAPDYLQETFEGDIPPFVLPVAIEELPDAALDAFTKAVTANPAFLWHESIFTHYFSMPNLVEPPPFIEDNPLQEVVIYYSWRGLGEWPEWEITISDADTEVPHVAGWVNTDRRYSSQIDQLLESNDWISQLPLPDDWISQLPLPDDWISQLSTTDDWISQLSTTDVLATQLSTMDILATQLSTMDANNTTPEPPSGQKQIETTIDPALVQAIASALTNLIPMNQTFELESCCDNYPNWTATLTFSDGTILELGTYSSNFLFAGGPWQVTMGGAIYMQYSPDLLQVMLEIGDALDLPGASPSALFFGGYEDSPIDLAFPIEPEEAE